MGYLRRLNREQVRRFATNQRIKEQGSSLRDQPKSQLLIAGFGKSGRTVVASSARPDR